MPCFRTCSARRPRSQAPLCHCTRRAIAIRAEGTLGSLCYPFGGDHPSQTTRQAGSPARAGLAPGPTQGRISTAANSHPGVRDRSLRPILRNVRPKAALSYSKGSRGLSVPLRVRGIFTATSISPSSRPRQRPDRYTIRAGRNLPDKEFRYLRTVIVTAAVYRGFGSALPPEGFTPPLNLPAPGRCQALYVASRLGRAMGFC